MKTKQDCLDRLTKANGVFLASLIAGPLALSMLAQAEQPPTKGHSRYKLIDLGTLGGRGSSVTGSAKILNHQGTLVGGADTPNPDPFRTMTRSDVIQSQQTARLKSYKMSDVRVKPVTANVAIICYIFEQDGLGSDGLNWDPKVAASATYAKRGGVWYSVFYQETVIHE